jgi:hypothetical protein
MEALAKGFGARQVTLSFTDTPARQDVCEGTVVGIPAIASPKKV